MSFTNSSRGTRCRAAPRSLRDETAPKKFVFRFILQSLDCAVIYVNKANLCYLGSHTVAGDHIAVVCVVIYVRPVTTSLAGWFAPRCPNLSFSVEKPAASAKIKCPRQIPNIGISVSKNSLCMLAIGMVLSAGLPGPFDSTMPSGRDAAIFSADVSYGNMVTLQPLSSSSRRIFSLYP